jgi:hypothetical protein
MDILSQAKKLLANMTADKLAMAKGALAELTQSWTVATEAFKAGDGFRRPCQDHGDEAEGSRSAIDPRDAGARRAEGAEVRGQPRPAPRRWTRKC